MHRPPVRASMAGVLISALTIVMTCLLGAAPVSAAQPGSAIEFDTALTLQIARCEGCVITLLSNDGANPIYSSAPAAVSGGSVTITLPSARTSGMSVRVAPPWVSSSAADINVVWRYAGKAIGDSIGFKEARSKRRGSGCWAGTVNEAVTLTVKVRRVSHRGHPSAIAWAPVTESFVPPMSRIRGGVLGTDDVLACNVYS